MEIIAIGYTQRMSLAKVTIRSLPLTDPPVPEGGGRIQSKAGELAQVVNGEQFRFLAYIEFGHNNSRGNHYHLRRTEILYVVSGQIRAAYLDLDTEESMTTILQSGDLVTVKPRCAHRYDPLEYSQAIEISASTYDPADTIAHNIDVESLHFKIDRKDASDLRDGQENER